MQRHNVKINSLNTEDYNVLSQGNPRIELPKLNFTRLVVPHRIMPQYQQETEKTPGSLELTLNGVFTTVEERVNFETDVIHAISNQAINTLELGSSTGIEYKVKLESPVVTQEITDNSYAKGSVIVTYNLRFSIELYTKK